ncbi:MAG TPA: hypothetical protein DD412_07630 [Holosporales bacterium]|nr:hypothetical protein [Holosporales bacterium]
MLFSPKNKFFGLLISLLTLFVMGSLFDHGTVLRIAVNVSLMFVLIFSVLLVSNSKIKLIAAIILACPLLYTLFEGNMSESAVFSYFEVATALAFFVYILAILVENVFGSRRISTDIIVGSICIYFLMCILWAFLYMLVALTFPNSFNIDSSLISFQNMNDFIYYSIVTITTLGYGDILPLSRPARTLAALEAIVGQIYLTVLIARIVGIHLSQRVKN